MKILLTIAFAVAASLAGSSGADLVLVEKARPAARVVLGSGASADEREAARELVLHIRKATGVELPMAGGGGTQILVGLAACPPEVRARVARLQGEGFVIEASAGKLILAGKPPHGTSFAVYTFLERFAGVRWLWPGDSGTVVPKAAVAARAGRLDCGAAGLPVAASRPRRLSLGPRGPLDQAAGTRHHRGASGGAAALGQAQPLRRPAGPERAQLRQHPAARQVRPYASGVLRVGEWNAVRLAEVRRQAQHAALHHQPGRSPPDRRVLPPILQRASGLRRGFDRHERRPRLLRMRPLHPARYRRHAGGAGGPGLGQEGALPCDHGPPRSFREPGGGRSR